ncbi:MAG: hypothetical protein QOF60_400 [Actinomycetota bacterium]|jgi:hypothetical protein|nr:hypothetical protein [Actinomycetota bacterium]
MSSGRRTLLGLGIGSGWTIGAGLAAWFFGLGGYRSGFLVVGAVLAPGVIAAVVVLPRARVAYGLALALIAFTSTSLVVATSPPSKSELSRRLGRVSIPYYREVSGHSFGTSTCRPACPGVERTYLGPMLGTRAGVLDAAVALDREGLLAPPRLRRSFSAPRLDDQLEDVRVRVSVAKQPPDGHLLVTIRLDGRR